MSFGFLPLPLFLLLVVSLVIVLLRESIKLWKREYKSLLVGYIMIALSSTFVGLVRIGEQVQWLESFTWLIELLMGISGVLGIVLIHYSGYKKSEGDPPKRIFVLRLIATEVILLSIGGAAVLYAIVYL